MGGILRHWEGVRPAAVGGMDPQKHSVGCLRGASKFPGRNWFSLGFWRGDGRGRWRWRAPLFPTKLSSIVRGLRSSPSLCPPAFPLSEQSCSLMTSQTLSRARCGNTVPRPLRYCQPDSGALLGRRAAPPPPLPPASPWSAHRLAALPTLFRGPLVCVWLRRLRSANPLAVFWVI